MTTHENDSTQPPAAQHEEGQDLAEVDGAQLLDNARASIARYVILPGEHSAAAVVLWVAATHGMPAWNAAPRLVIKAPEKRCGKSRLLDLVEALAHKSLMTTNASPSAVYRSIGLSPKDPPTLLIDEADTIFGPKAGDNEDLRGLLNAGHQRGRPALRYDAGRRTVDRIDTFAMAALAGIGHMPETIEDRAVIISMRRRAPDETVQPYRVRRDGPALASLRTQLNQWVRAHLDQLLAAVPTMPVEDRAADTWEPLIALADLAGGHWPDTAREAATALTAGDQDDDNVSLRVRLLIDCRTAFGEALALPSASLLSRLRADPEAPWAELGPEGLKPRRLGIMLSEFGIKPSNHRWEDGTQSKGFDRLDFNDAWRRYCPPEPTTSGTRPIRPNRPRPSQHRDGTDPWDGSIRPNTTSVPSPARAGTVGTDGTGPPQQAHAAVCITCRQTLTYDDGTHTHPTCTTREGNE